jgi:hypothetical protein
MSNSLILYRGPSMLDGAPIVVVVSGLRKKSDNSKTGNVLQTWIIRDDMSPIDALRSGDDVSICGLCPHRGINGQERSCYVDIIKGGPTSIYRTLAKYETATDIASLGRNRVVRLGSYGDPAAVPLHIWHALVSECEAHTGYTHQWKTYADKPALAALCMASCDNVVQALEAIAMGFRPFRVRRESDPVMPREVVCPASKEAGYKTTCSLCRACGGTSAKAKAPIVIAAHGSGKKHFERSEKLSAPAEHFASA